MALFPRDKAESLQDHPDIVAALDEMGVRMDANDEGWIWRVMLFERNGNDTLTHLRELPELQEVWVVGSRVTRDAIERLQEEFPDLVIRQ